VHQASISLHSVSSTCVLDSFLLYRTSFASGRWPLANLHELLFRHAPGVETRRVRVNRTEPAPVVHPIRRPRLIWRASNSFRHTPRFPSPDATSAIVFAHAEMRKDVKAVPEDDFRHANRNARCWVSLGFETTGCCIAHDTIGYESGLNCHRRAEFDQRGFSRAISRSRICISPSMQFGRSHLAKPNVSAYPI